jgi:DNA-binding NarL/FixJ family response regulator
MGISGESSVTSVLLIDAPPIVRAGFDTILELRPDLLLDSRVLTIADALAWSDPAQPAVVVDASETASAEADRITALRQAHPHCGILVISHRPERPAAALAIQAGASGFISRSAAIDDIVDAIATIADGHRYLPPAVAQALADHVATSSDLSPREHEVLLLLAEGQRISDVARILNINVKTASTHKTNLQRKLGVTSLAGLIRYAIDHGLTSPTT